MHYVLKLHQSFAFYHDRGTKNSPGLLVCPWTYSQDVLGHSWPNGGPSGNKQKSSSSSRHLLYFKIARISLGCLDHNPFTMTKSLKKTLLSLSTAFWEIYIWSVIYLEFFFLNLFHSFSTNSFLESDAT